MDRIPKETQSLTDLRATLATLLDLPADEVTLRSEGEGGVDLAVSAADYTFAVERCESSAPGVVAALADKAKMRAKRLGKRSVPLVVVPFMSATSRAVTETAGVAWFDLCGNARIVAPGLRVLIDGRADRFRRPGRPASLFAPKSARVARWLLIHSAEAFTQRQIARSTGMTEGFVSRIVAGLERANYVVRGPKGAVRVKETALLLDAWREEYRFSKHLLIKGHVPARSGDALTRLVSDALENAGAEHAATGLSAAWQLTHFASFRTATFFVTSPPSTELKRQLTFREDAKGPNLWLVVPNDVGVLHGAEDRDGVRCVHPVQAYLDLKEHPERAPEAADRLRTDVINGEHRD